MREAEDPNIIPAGIWRRIGASLVDCLILLCVIALIIVVCSTLVVGVFAAVGDKGIDPVWSGFLVIGSSLLSVFLMALSLLLYFACFERSEWQATPGKRLLGLKVQDSQGARLSFGVAVLRAVLYMLPSFIIAGAELSKARPDSIGLESVGHILNFIFVVPIFFTKDKTTLYDMLSKTRVVVRQPELEQQQVGGHAQEAGTEQSEQVEPPQRGLQQQEQELPQPGEGQESPQSEQAPESEPGFQPQEQELEAEQEPQQSERGPQGLHAQQPEQESEPEAGRQPQKPEEER